MLFSLGLVIFLSVQIFIKYFSVWRIMFYDVGQRQKKSCNLTRTASLPPVSEKHSDSSFFYLPSRGLDQFSWHSSHVF